MVQHRFRARTDGRLNGAGFTLVELVVVIIIFGIVAVVALPRFADRTAFDAAGFYEEVQASVRYAQKEAIAKRRTVCLDFDVNYLEVKFAPAVGSAVCTADLVSPRGVTPFRVTAGSGISFSSAADFSYDPLGRPSAGQTIVIAGDGSRSFTVEAETGYVHP